MNALLSHAFNDLNLNRVYSEVFSDNPALANQFYDKLGFQREGLLRQNAYKEGKYIDCVVIGILKDEWTSRWNGLNRQETSSELKPLWTVG